MLEKLLLKAQKRMQVVTGLKGKENTRITQNSRISRIPISKSFKSLSVDLKRPSVILDPEPSHDPAHPPSDFENFSTNKITESTNKVAVIKSSQESAGGLILRDLSNLERSQEEIQVDQGGSKEMKDSINFKGNEKYAELPANIPTLKTAHSDNNLKSQSDIQTNSNRNSKPSISPQAKNTETILGLKKLDSIVASLDTIIQLQKSLFKVSLTS